jgi:hypothetical protein
VRVVVKGGTGQAGQWVFRHSTEHLVHADHRDGNLNARNGQNAGCRLPSQSIGAGDPKCDESDVVGRHAGRQ